MKKVTPHLDRVLVKPSLETEKTYGSIIIPDLGNEKAEIAEVVAVGPGRTTEFGQFIEVRVKEGDKVLLPKIGYFRIDIEGVEHYLIQDKEILAVIE